MPLSLQDIKGPIVVTAKVQNKPGKADELAQWFTNLKARADSDLELGTLSYRMFRLGSSFAVFEEYADHEATGKHTKENPLFQEYWMLREELVDSVPPLFWPAMLLPEPTITHQNGRDCHALKRLPFEIE